MALNLAVRYAGQVDVDAAYPQGKARNVVTEGDGTGFPFEKDFVNDILGWQQALLLASGITPSATPDTAIASQYLMAFYRLIGRVDGWGALGNDSADDTAALQAALDAVSLYGGHQELHLVPGKIYRHTGLIVPLNVDIYFHGATLAINHATAPALTYIGTVSAADVAPRKLVGGTFSAVIANNGVTVKYDVTNGSLDVVDCQFGVSAFSTGKFITFSGFRLSVDGSLFYGNSDTAHVDFGGTILRMADCRHHIPTTYSTECVRINASHAWVLRCRHLLTSHNSGTMSCYQVIGGKIHFDHNVFENDGSDAGVVFAMQWGAGVHIFEADSQFIGKVTPYRPDAGVTLEAGSRLSLVEYQHTTYTGATCALPVGVANAVSLSTEVGGTINLEFPVGLFPGQVLRSLLSTTYGGATTPAIAGAVPVSEATMVTLTAGYVQSAPFVWMDPAGGTSYKWVQTSPWTTVN